MSPYITTTGLIMGIVITGSIIFAYFLGKEVGRDKRSK